MVAWVSVLGEHAVDVAVYSEAFSASFATPPRVRATSRSASRKIFGSPPSRQAFRVADGACGVLETFVQVFFVAS